MKQQQSKGALIVTILLAAASVLVMLSLVVSTCVAVWAPVGKNTVEAVQPEETPEPTPDWAQEMRERRATSVRMECFTDDKTSTMHANIMGYDGEQNVWIYVTPDYPLTELDPITEIHCFEDIYLFCADGEVTALDVATGEVLWCNREFGGASPSFDLDEERNIYLTGYYGPDLHVMDIDGNTLCHVEQFDSQYYWPTGVRKADENTVEVTFCMGPQEGEYVVSYNMATGEAQLPQAAVSSWQQAYLNMLQTEEMQAYYSMALLRIDADEIPELYLAGNDGDRLCVYNEQQGVVMIKNLESYSLNYKLGQGLFNEYIYSEERIVENLYRLEGGNVLPVAQVESIPGKDEDGYLTYRYIWDGQEVDSSEHSERYDAAYGYDAVSYPATFPREQLMEAIRSWDDPSDDERIWKERLSSIVNIYSDCLGYNLIDFDGNGVPELFFYKEADYGDYGYITVCDVKTQQTSMQYVSAYDVGYIAGTGVVCDTQFYGETSASDALYQVGESSVVIVQNGNRYTYGEDSAYYLNGESASEEEYFSAFGVLATGEVLSANDGCVSAEEILKQLQ